MTTPARGHKPNRTIANRPDPRRYPLAPLAQAAGITLGQTGGDQHYQRHERRGLLLLAEQLGIGKTWAQHLHRYGLTEEQADRYAIALGHHPSHIWPQWWDTDDDTNRPNLDDALDDLTDNGGDIHGLAF